jgi:hypothetical protein
LKFSEVAYDQPGKRVFGVKINGKSVIDSLDLFAKVGKDHAYDRIFVVTVTNGLLNIDFVKQTEFPCVSAIVVQSNAKTIKINCGGPAYGDYESDLNARPEPSVKDLYEDWTSVEFGPEVSKQATALFCSIDGKLPRPLTWTDGPGGITPDSRKWDDVRKEYSFVSQFRALRETVRGEGELQRFDYWLRNFEYLRLVGELRCVWAETISAKGSDLDRSKARMIELVGSIYDRLLANVDTAGELGNIANWEQHLLPALFGKDTKMPLDYRGPLRVFIPTIREVVAKGENLAINASVLSKKPIQKIELSWRPLGIGKFRVVAMRPVNRGVYRTTLEINDDIEYRITVVDEAGNKAQFPVKGTQSVVAY